MRTMSQPSSQNTTHGSLYPPPVLQLAINDSEEKSNLQSVLDSASRGPQVQHVHRHRLLHLCSAIKGYHKGSLDLAGRHPQRYYSLISQWGKFLHELESQSDATCTRKNNWLSFRERWGLPSTMNYNDARQLRCDVLAVLEQSPTPVIQKLFFADLPSELLDSTFFFIPTQDAKALSCTSSQFNRIGRRHIFRHRNLRLHLSPNISTVNVEYSDVDLPTVAKFAREDLFKDVYSITASSLARAQIQSLLITDEWWPRGRVLVPEQGDHRNPFLLNDEFYRPIYEHLFMALYSVPRLTDLTLSNLDITRDFLITISTLPCLNSLSLDYCRVPTIAQACILLDRLPTSSTLANLNILIDPDAEETRTQWYALILFPRIRTLSVGGVGQVSFPLPDPSIRGRCHLPYLERLSLHDFDPSEIDSLSSWLHIISGPSNLRLTHFKLHSSWGISDASISSLLRSLEAAPLKVLVIEGLANAELALFDCISVLFPQLVALTLTRRQNNYQLENRAVAWPHASWEYAQRLTGFRHLRHFCWNFSMVYHDATPASLLAIENNFIAAEGEVEDETMYFMDSHWTALPFAAYCSSLETFAIVDRVIDMACHVNRNPITKTATLKVALPPISTWNIDQWNTMDYRWPSLPSPNLRNILH